MFICHGSKGRKRSPSYKPRSRSRSDRSRRKPPRRRKQRRRSEPRSEPREDRDRPREDPWRGRPPPGPGWDPHHPPPHLPPPHWAPYPPAHSPYPPPMRPPAGWMGAGWSGEPVRIGKRRSWLRDGPGGMGWFEVKNCVWGLLKAYHTPVPIRNCCTFCWCISAGMNFECHQAPEGLQQLDDLT